MGKKILATQMSLITHGEKVYSHSEARKKKLGKIREFVPRLNLPLTSAMLNPMNPRKLLPLLDEG